MGLEEQPTGSQPGLPGFLLLVDPPFMAGRRVVLVALDPPDRMLLLTFLMGLLVLQGGPQFQDTGDEHAVSRT